MKRNLLYGLVLVIALAFASPAFAFECPKHMKAIDAKISMATNLPADKLAKVKELRAEGEKLHKEGKHAESVKVLKEAEALLAS
jgi:hypothetical protein